MPNTDWRGCLLRGGESSGDGTGQVENIRIAETRDSLYAIRRCPLISGSITLDAFFTSSTV